jgi:hypothetical protein
LEDDPFELCVKGKKLKKEHFQIENPTLMKNTRASKPRKLHIKHLPDEILFHILTFLPPPDLAQLGCCCSRFNKVNSQDTIIF